MSEDERTEGETRAANLFDIRRIIGGCSWSTR